MKKKNLLLGLIIFLFCFQVFPSDSHFEKSANDWLLKSFDCRNDVKSLAYLSSFNQLFNFYNEDEVLDILEKIIKAPDSQPLLVAMARNEKRFILTMKGKFPEVKESLNQDCFITDFLILAPFSNENKEGFKTTYDVENELNFKKKYSGYENREITFRKLPKFEYTSNILLDNFIDPSDKSTAYLCTFIYSPKTLDCVIRCSFNGAFKIFLNGEEIGVSENYNIPTFDQYSFKAKLSSGYNILMVKSCNSDTFWQLRMRLTDGKGNPLKGISITNDESKVTESVKSILKKDGRANDYFKFINPLEELEERAKKENPEDIFLYALYLFGTKCFDKSDPKDLEEFKSIIDKGEGFDNVSYFAAKSESDFNRARDFYEKGSKDGNYKFESLFELYNYYKNRNMPLKAMEYLNSLLEMEKDNLILRIEKLYLLRSSSILAPFTLNEIQKIYLENQDDYNVLKAFLDFTDDDNFQGKIRLLSNYKKIRFDRFVYSELFRTYSTIGKKEEAIATLKEYLNKFPYERDFIISLCMYEKNMGFYKEAKEEIGSILKYAPDWAMGHQLLGECLLKLGSNEESLLQFEKSLTLNPQNDDLKRRITYLKPEEESFYLKYRINDNEIDEPVDKYESEPLQILLDNTYTVVEKSGLSTRYSQYVAKVQSAYGVQIISTYPITYDPDWQDLRVLEAYALREDGTKLRANSYSTSYLSDTRYQLYYRNKQLVLYFSGLKKGDVVHYEYIMTDKIGAKTFGNYFGDVVPFQSYYPILKKTYILKVPESLKISFKNINGDVEQSVAKTGDSNLYIWSKKDIPAIKNEPYSPGFSEIFPYIHISTFTSWEELGKWYSSFIKDQWELSKEAKDLVKELIKDKNSTVDKVKAIHGWVAKNTHYVGLEFGVHGYKPYKASRIFERRFGDCKDKALLLCAMLKEAGIDADMVLVRTKNLGLMVEKSPVSLATFNHAIAYIPELDIFLDGTAEFSGINELPYLDQGIDVLVVGSDGNAEVKRTKENSPEENLFYANYTFNLIKGKEEVEAAGKYMLSGVECAMLRQDFQNEEKRKEVLEKQLSRNYPFSKMDEAKFSGIDDLNQNIEINFKGTMRNIFDPSSRNGILANVWMGNVQLASTYTPLSTRKVPIVIPYATKQVYEITYTSKTGFSEFRLEPKEFSTKFGSYKREVSKEGNNILVKSELILSGAKVEVDDYLNFKEFLNQIDKATQERIEIKW
jgi:transglutaminase-like putative cysteine protease